MRCCKIEKAGNVRHTETDNYQQTEKSFIEAIATIKHRKHRWAVPVTIKNNIITFHADTQADVSAIPEHIYSNFIIKIELRKPEITLYGADSEILNNVIGCFYERFIIMENLLLLRYM